MEIWGLLLWDDESYLEKVEGWCNDNLLECKVVVSMFEIVYLILLDYISMLCLLIVIVIIICGF